ncbi:ribose-phosphate pyrophosphokinase [Savitreella phatthalungensis]
MRGCVVLGTNGHPDLTKSICSRLGMTVGEVDIKKFSNGETSVTIHNSVRGQDVYIVSPGSGQVNDNLMEMLIMISACKTASANKVTAVLPVFPYSRQPDVPYSKTGAPSAKPLALANNALLQSLESRPGTPVRDRVQAGSSALQKEDSSASFIPDKTAPNASGYRKWVAQAGTLVAALLTTAGADHIITMDLHDPQFQGFFDIPVDNLFGRPLLQRFITLNIPNYQDAVIVSPDAGGAKRATAIADSLQMEFALIHKERRNKHNQHDESSMMLVGDVEDKTAILIDDLVDTGATLTRAAKLLHESGATEIYALVTHALLSGDALQRIKESQIDVLVVTNTSPQQEHVDLLGQAEFRGVQNPALNSLSAYRQAQSRDASPSKRHSSATSRKGRIVVIDVAPVFAEAIRRIHNGESVSMLFDHGI